MQKHCLRLFVLCCLLLAGITARATIFGSIRGVVHDPQHRPVASAAVQLKSGTSDWSRAAESDSEGTFEFDAVPIGEYSLTVTREGFATASESVVVNSGSAPILHFMLNLASIAQNIEVKSAPNVVDTGSPTTQTLVSRADIAQTPGADRTNSLQEITDYVPGAYMVHDQLHIRGGHQVSWLVDGVPVPNTSIASNVGPQFDPKDVDYLEIQRGSYEAEYGDRTYGVFNVVPRTGFERQNEAELVMSFGNFYQTNDQINFGSHTDRFAYYASVNGNRSDLGLETPVGRIIHDDVYGYGGFGSFIFNVDPSNQLRLVTSL